MLSLGKFLKYESRCDIFISNEYFYAKHTLYERILLTLALLRHETFQHSEALTSV